MQDVIIASGNRYEGQIIMTPNGVHRSYIIDTDGGTYTIYLSIITDVYHNGVWVKKSDS